MLRRILAAPLITIMTVASIAQPLRDDPGSVIQGTRILPDISGTKLMFMGEDARVFADGPVMRCYLATNAATPEIVVRERDGFCGYLVLDSPAKALSFTRLWTSPRTRSCFKWPRYYEVCPSTVTNDYAISLPRESDDWYEPPSAIFSNGEYRVSRTVVSVESVIWSLTEFVDTNGCWLGENALPLQILKEFDFRQKRK